MQWMRFLPALLLVVAIPLHSWAQADAPRYEKVPATRDAIGKAFLGRQIARVMSWHNASWLERPARANEEKPDLILAALDLKAGMTVADIGAGSGYYASRMAERVGPGGLVYAVDVQPGMIEYLNAQMARHERFNVAAVLGTATDSRLEAASIDLAIMVDVYHEFEYPFEMLTSIVRALRPGGRVAFIEYRANDPTVPIKPEHAMTEAQVRREAALHPLDWEKTVTDLPRQLVVVFRKRE
jgi:SAM-dependent methyltransferase